MQALTRRLVQTPTTKPKQYKVESDNLDDRIDYIVDEINRGKRYEGTRRIAAQVLRKKVRSKDWENEAKALFEWTRTNIRYTLDPDNVELFQSTERSMELGIGDCDDQAIVLSSLLQSVGIPAKLRVIGLKGSKVFQHIYVLAGVPPHAPTKWLPLDASRQEAAGWELPASERGLLRDYKIDDYDPDD